MILQNALLPYGYVMNVTDKFHSSSNQRQRIVTIANYLKL